MAVWRITEKSLWSVTPQHHMQIQKCELNWLSFLKLEPWATFQTNTTVAAPFVKIFGRRRCSFWSWLLKIRKDLCSVACFCLIYIYIPYFWRNYIHSLFFFWYIFLWIPACLELVFLFLKKEFTSSGFFAFSFKESIDFGTSRKSNSVEKQPESSQGRFWW